MNKWETVGIYLGRVVRAIQVPSNCGGSFNENTSLSSSLVLIYFGLKLPLVDVDRLLEDLARHAPLAIVLAGKGAEAAFDHLIDILGRRPTERHVMTKLCLQQDVSEFASDFLSATWPAEDRFDEWKTYSVFVLESDLSRYSSMISAIRKLIDA